VEKVYWLLAVILVVGLLVGCPEPYVAPETPVYDGGAVSIDGMPPDGQNWISPGKVEVGNYFPGARAEWPITIHNGNNEQAEFSLVYKYPNRVLDGYSFPEYGAVDWVSFDDSLPLLAPRETKDVLVILEMPKDADFEEGKWEFWISVKDMSQGSFVQTEMVSKWRVDMR